MAYRLLKLFIFLESLSETIVINSRSLLIKNNCVLPSLHSSIVLIAVHN